MVASRFPSRPFQLREHVWFIRQEGNSSLVGFQLWIDKLSYSPTYSGGRAHRWMKINGGLVHESYGNGFDFRNGDNFLLAQGEVWVGHEWNGYKTFAIEAWAGFDILGDTSLSTNFTLPRIPKTPNQGPQATLSNFTPTSVRVNGSYVDDMGAAIEEWQFAATPTSPGGVQNIYSHNGPVLDCGNLVPGVSYRFQYRARNSQGWAPWSPDAYGTPGLPAPSLTSWAQVGDSLRATWAPPSATNGLTGYRLQVATNDTFTAGLLNLDVADVTQADVAGLSGGRRYWARVAARTAGGVNAWSTSRAVMLVLESGNLDGWARLGAKPAGLTYFTATGIRRGILNGAQALWLESNATGAGQTVPADTVGIQRQLTGLTPGKSYRFRASMTGAYAALDASRAHTYRLGVDGRTAAPATLLDPVGTVELPWVEFIAGATTAVLKIIQAEPIQTAGADAEAERVAFHGITVDELNTDYPQRLRDTVYESNLANHFDLACNSVGATWYVAKDGVTRFNPPGAALPISATFADVNGDGVLEYVDIAAGYDTNGTINRIEATNYGLGEDGLEDNDTVVVNDQRSQDAYGVLSTRLDVNLWDQAPYDRAFSDRLGQLLADHADPELFVSEIRWNAQQDLAALAALEIGQRVRVLYRGNAQDSQIVNLSHDVQPTRWITTIALQKL